MNEHSKSNTSKVKNGLNFEKEFSLITGFNELKNIDKKSFQNYHGITQKIDFDHFKEINGRMIYVDTSTTYRSDRLKQKAYNGLMMKVHFGKDIECYMVIKKDIENGKKMNPKLIEGIDGVYSVDDFIEKILKNNNNNNNNNL